MPGKNCFMRTPIYLDNNATTQVAPEVFDAMRPFLTDAYGNPSSSYLRGREARDAVENARRNVAGLLGASDLEEIVFTSCGTESDNWAIRGALSAMREKNALSQHASSTRRLGICANCLKLRVTVLPGSMLTKRERSILIR